VRLSSAILHCRKGFDLSYIGADERKTPAGYAHRVILGAVERFIGVLSNITPELFPLAFAYTMRFIDSYR